METAGFQYAKEQLPLLKLRSRLLNPNLAQQVVQVNRDRKYFSTSSTREYDKSQEQADKEEKSGIEPWKKQVLVLPSRDNFTITPKGNFEVLQFLSRNQNAEFSKGKGKVKYFEFNGSQPITTYLVNKDIVDAQNGTIETQLWLCRLGGGSELVGDSQNLDYADWARGVLKKTAEGGRAPRKTGSKREQSYSLSNIRTATDKAVRAVLEEKKLTGLEAKFKLTPAITKGIIKRLKQ